MIFDAATSVSSLFAGDNFIELVLFVVASIFLFWWCIYKSEKSFAQNTIMNSKVEYEELDESPRPLHKLQRDAMASSKGDVSYTSYMWYFNETTTSSFKQIPGFIAPGATTLEVLHKTIHCYCISDLHADMGKNHKWIEEHCVPASRDAFNILIIPGDVGTDIEMLIKVFGVLSKAYDLVCYIPGNHETWVDQNDSSALKSNYNSVDKLMDIYAALERFRNVVCGPLKLSYPCKTMPGEFRRLLVMPMHGWYHASWDKEPHITNPLYLEAEKITPFRNQWIDYRLCRWPEEVISSDAFIYNPSLGFHRDDAALAEAFAGYNEPYLHVPPTKSVFSSLTESTFQPSTFFGSTLTGPFINNQAHGLKTTVLSYSHYLPRQELLPEKRVLLAPLLATVVGSDVLESQLRRLQPDLHLFGHTHIPIDLTLEGLRYLQWPLGYAREALRQCAPIHKSGPLKVFDSDLGDSAGGIPSHLPTLDVDWTIYYSKPNARDPNNTTDLADWLKVRLETLVKTKAEVEKNAK